MKRVIYLICFIILTIILLVILTGCSSKNEDTDVIIRNTKNTSVVNNVEGEKDSMKVYYAENAERQMALPNEGETIAIIKVKNYGEMKFKFFENIAPKAVENFLTHSKDGYYDNLTFHRIINEFMIQGGDPEGNGYGGESIWGEGFGPELDEALVPYRGSLCMAMSSLPNSIGSQFFITQANYDERYNNYIKSMTGSDELVEQYKKYGGSIPSLYMQYTVFGQLYEGFEVLDKIAKEAIVEDDNGTVSPENQPVIESIKVTTYQGK